eukprot:gnl/MRDRNA2_/MRDRNA2_258724_c0_seq1.p1 gnl/MRDRNA2_/MRDRNA2_258724_c0~~gnl/MRDRNA2_/MRDRNA2_258724_c0_seq1.p1  ORF type:complete len:496 (+),score=81.37 gnl/MRDRNA2_/MRDRNA2_258724_c0_seq1:223-1710(+)
MKHLIFFFLLPFASGTAEVHAMNAQDAVDKVVLQLSVKLRELKLHMSATHHSRLVSTVCKSLPTRQAWGPCIRLMTGPLQPRLRAIPDLPEADNEFRSQRIQKRLRSATERMKMKNAIAHKKAQQTDECPGCRQLFSNLQKHMGGCCPELLSRLHSKEELSLQRKGESPNDWLGEEEVRLAGLAAIKAISNPLHRRALELRFGVDREGLRRTPAEVGVELGGEFAKRPDEAHRLIRNAMKSIPLVADDPSQLYVIFEDDELLAVGKPPGLRTMPVHRFLGKSLLNQLVGYLDPPGGAPPPYPVHRLDQDTTGVVVVAKTKAAGVSLQAQWHTTECQKTYLAILHKSKHAQARSTGDRFVVDAAIAKAGDFVDEVKRAVNASGQAAMTRFEVLAQSSSAFLVRCTLVQGGRTHQIRVHAMSVGLPLVGDGLYGGPHGESAHISRLALHAWRLQVPHPKNGERISLTAPLPEDMRLCCVAHDLDCATYVEVSAEAAA